MILKERRDEVNGASIYIGDGVCRNLFASGGISSLHLLRNGKVVHRRRYPTASLILLSLLVERALKVWVSGVEFCSIDKELSYAANCS